MGRDLSYHQPDVAPELGAPDTVFCIPGRHSQGDIHDQRDRVTEHVAAQSNQDTGIVSDRGCGAEVAVPGAGTYCQEVDHAGAELEGSLAAFCDSAGRPGSTRRFGLAWRNLVGRHSAARRRARAGGARSNARDQGVASEKGCCLLLFYKLERPKTKKNCGPWKSGNPKPGFPLSHRPECLRRKEKTAVYTKRLTHPSRQSVHAGDEDIGHS